MTRKSAQLRIPFTKGDITVDIESPVRDKRFDELVAAITQQIFAELVPALVAIEPTLGDHLNRYTGSVAFTVGDGKEHDTPVGKLTLTLKVQTTVPGSWNAVNFEINKFLNKSNLLIQYIDPQPTPEHTTSETPASEPQTQRFASKLKDLAAELGLDEINTNPGDGFGDLFRGFSGFFKDVTTEFTEFIADARKEFKQD